LVDARAAVSFHVAPVIMPELVERIYTFKAGAPDVDDITAGYSLFLLTTGSPEANTQARERAMVYGMLHGGHVAPTLDQLKAIVLTAPQMAKSLIALERNYQGYSTLLDVLLGANHRVSLHFHEFVEDFMTLKMEVEEQFGAEIHAALPLFQRHTQLTMARYFNDATVRGANATLPKIYDLIDIIKFRQWPQLPQLPPRYTHTLGPGGSPGTSTRTPAGPVSNTTCSGTGNTSGGNGTRFMNVAPNTILMAWFERTPKCLGDLTRNEALIPRGDNGTEVLCLSHILRGECNTACHQAAMHRALTQTEQSQVGEILTQASVE
jgi:hypothetical protein